MSTERNDESEKRGRAILWKGAGWLALFLIAASGLALLKLPEGPVTTLRLWVIAAGVFNLFMIFVVAGVLGAALKEALSPSFEWRALAFVLASIAVSASVYYAGLSFFHAQLGNEQSRPEGWTLLFLAAVPVIAILFALEDLANHIFRKREPSDSAS